MVFADDERESNPTSFKFLQMAHAWRNAQAKRAGGGSALLSGFTASTEAVPSSEQPHVQSGNDRNDRDDAHSDVASSHGSD